MPRPHKTFLAIKFSAISAITMSLILSLTIFTFEAFIASPVSAACCDLAGDSDNSGTVTIGDVTFLISYIFSGGSAPVCPDEGDPDVSGSIAIGDVTYLIARIFSGGPAPECGSVVSPGALPYVIVETGQDLCYDNSAPMTPPSVGTAFYGQDAQYTGVEFSYVDNGDGTITDLNTGLMWQQTPDLNNKPTFSEAVAGAATFNLAGYTDWRLPSIKELYSLINFTGVTPMIDTVGAIPYLDLNYFGFEYGDESAGERLIDAQYWSSAEYVGTVFNGMSAVFGVNFADGRIKGYGLTGAGGSDMVEFVRYVRGNTDYGVNDFTDNSDSTITDLATGLMWQKADNGSTLNWAQALDYSENLTLAGHSDWRLPNAKELQSILDYTRAPDAALPAQQGPAIDPVFDITETESWFWSSTTHLDGPDQSFAVYLCFGRSFGYMPTPFGDTVYMNVHGAGSQRSDPKDGDPADYPTGHGPQGDEIRIFNYVRCVRDAD